MAYTLEREHCDCTEAYGSYLCASTKREHTQIALQIQLYTIVVKEQMFIYAIINQQYCTVKYQSNWTFYWKWYFCATLLNREICVETHCRACTTGVWSYFRYRFQILATNIKTIGFTIRQQRHYNNNENIICSIPATSILNL